MNVHLLRNLNHVGGMVDTDSATKLAALSDEEMQPKAYQVLRFVIECFAIECHLTMLCNASLTSRTTRCLVSSVASIMRCERPNTKRIDEEDNRCTAKGKRNTDYAQKCLAAECSRR